MWKKESGCVYFIKHKGLDPIKIGYSTIDNPKKRFEKFLTFAPFGGELVGFVKSSMALEMERDLHEKYKIKRLKGEWFSISIEDVKKEIETIKKLETLFK